MNDSDRAAEIERLINRAKLAKEQAKDLRDDRDFDGAVEVLKRVVQQITSSPVAPQPAGASPADADERRLATQLADCIGMMGGNLRRADRLKEALEAFETGRNYEESARLMVQGSYNLVNAITLPLEEQSTKAAELHDALVHAVSTIEQQVAGERRMDRWAWADLAQCRLLLGQVDEALQSYQQAFALGDSDTQTSSLTVLRRLEGALRKKGDPMADSIAMAVRLYGG